MDFIRAVALDDIRIRSGGTGRTVEAYAAIFGEPAEIVDADGHYYEINHPTAFARTIAHRQGGFPVVYNHGMTIAGTPSDRGSVPIGVSKEVRVDTRGVLTVSEYGNSEPTPFPAFAGAAITGVRAQQVLGALLTAPAERRQALLDQLDHLATPLDEVDPDHVDADTPQPDEAPDSVEPAPTDNDPPSRHSARSLASRIRAARVTRGME
jgi:hypothetical protein